MRSFQCPQKGGGPGRKLTGAELVRDTKCRLTRLTWIAGAAGGVAVFLVIGSLIPIFVGPDQREELGLWNAPLIVAYIVSACLLVNVAVRAGVDRAAAWLVEDRDPTDAEHRQSLALAPRGVKLALKAWLGAVILFTLVNGIVHSWDFAAVVGATTWLGGETTVALSYLISERVLRPVTACALTIRPSDRNVAPGVRGRLAMAWLLGTG